MMILILVAMAVNIYLAIGVVFAIFFLFFGLGRRVDPNLSRSPVQARLALVPGAVLFWPLLLKNIILRKTGPDLNFDQGAADHGQD